VNLPAVLPGVDVKQGIRQIGGNSALFFKLLSDLFADHQNDVVLIRKAVENGDFDTAQRLAHTLKGVGGTIGAMELNKHAEQLEELFKSKELETLDSLMESFEDSMETVMSGLKDYLGQQTDSVIKKPDQDVTPEEILNRIQQLDTLLEEMDPEAEEIASKLHQLLGKSGKTRQLTTSLVQKVSGFEFEEAQEILKALRQTTQGKTDA